MKAETTYFASEPSESIVQRLNEKEQVFYDYVRSAGFVTKIRKSLAFLLGANLRSGAVTWEVQQGGESGELLHSAENHYAAIERNIYNIVSQARPTIQCEAANSDRASLEQTMLGDGLIRYQLSEKKLEDLQKRALRRAIRTGEGYVEGAWNVHAGDEVSPEPDAALAAFDAQESGLEAPPVQMLKAGEPEFHCHGLLELIRDPHAPSWEACPWLTTLRWMSRFDLAAMYPDKAADIAGATPRSDWRPECRVSFGSGSSATEMVAFRTFYHRQTPAVPQGRIVHYVDDVLLFDGPLPFKHIPVWRVTPEEIDGTPFGTTPMFDLQGPQEAVDALDSKILSSQMGRSTNNLLTGDGSDIAIEEVTSSFNVIRTKNVDQVKPLEWPQTPTEFFGFRTEKIDRMAAVAGTNKVAMGASEAMGNEDSGAKLALIEATAMRNQSSLEASYVGLIRDSALGVLRLYREFGGAHERVTKIAGKAKGYLVKTWTSAQLGDIDRVRVDVADPMLRTPGGKLAVAEKLATLCNFQPSDADKFLHVVKEGTLDPFLETKQAELLRIRGENENLMSGEGTHRALVTDPHWTEIPEHLSLLDNPGLREPTPENAQIQAGILAAVADHLQKLRTMDPGLVLLRGGPGALAIWQQFQGLGMPMAGGAPPPGGEPEQGGAPEQSQPEPVGPEMPQLPINPGTGERAQVLPPEGMAA